ncbi:MAG: glycosyltransferase [Candidatus Berkelbacteria bacterium]|nr:glycosyltransferase [Candidatus Berkelbacteria bacterium]
MKIGIFTDVYEPSINGVTTSIKTYRKSLEKIGHQVYIFAPSTTGALPETNVFRLPAIDELSPKDFPIAIPYIPSLAKTVKNLGIEIIHIQLPFTVGFIGHRIAKKLHIAEVHTYHTLLTEYSHYVPSELLQPLVQYGLKKLSKNFCNSMDINIAPSTSMMELLRSFGVKKPIVVNPTGIDISRFHHLNEAEKSKLFAEYKIPAHKKILLFGGRIAREKNLTVLCECYKEIRNTFPDTHLIFAGGGFATDESELKAKIKELGLTEFTTVTGFLKAEEIARFFGAADLFTFPSVTETQGIVLSEAMAGRTPVVAMNVFGPRDIVKNSEDGYLCDSQKEFQEKILYLLSHEKERVEMAAAAIKNCQRFSIEATTDHLVEIYKEAIGISKKKKRNNIFRDFGNLFIK